MLQRGQGHTLQLGSQFLGELHLVIVWGVGKPTGKLIGPTPSLSFLEMVLAPGMVIVHSLKLLSEE